MGAFDAPVYYDKGTYIETDTGNRVSRKALIIGPTNIVLGGKSIIQDGAVLRGDLRRSQAGSHVVISMGRYCCIGENAVVRPASRLYKGQTFTYYPLKLSDFVTIGKDAIVEAANVGHGVEIGEGAIIGHFVTIKELVVVRPGTVIAEGATLAPMTIWEGSPARMVGMVNETHQETVEARCKSFYARFRPTPT